MQNLRNDVKNDEKIRNMNEEEITKEAMNRLNAKIESVEDLQRTEKSFTINAIKSEKGWKLDITGTDVQEVISGKFINTIKKKGIKPFFILKNIKVETF